MAADPDGVFRGDHPGTPGDADARRALEAAWEGAGGRFEWWQAIVLLIVLSSVGMPPAFRATAAILLVTALATMWFRRRPFPARAPLRRGVVLRSSAAEVVVRLDDGALWGFSITPDKLGRLREGETVVLLEPQEGPIAVAGLDEVTGRYEGTPGRDARLYRPPPAALVGPVAPLGPGPVTGTLSEEQARTYLTHRIGRLNAGHKIAPRRRAVLADIGTEPRLELVETVPTEPGTVRVRRGDGAMFAWPVARQPARAGLPARWPPVTVAGGHRVWATRVDDGLYVALVVSTDDLRSDIVWPTGRAVPA